MDSIHLDQTVRDPADHVCGIVQMARLLLVQLGHSGKSIWSRGVFDDRLEGLYSRGIRLEEGDFGVATLGSLIEILQIGITANRLPTWEPRGISD